MDFTNDEITDSGWMNRSYLDTIMTPEKEVDKCKNIGYLVTKLIISQSLHDNDSNCTMDDLPGTAVTTFGPKFYAYVTPLIIIVGLVGNSISLNVFTSKGMRKQSASYYLAALSMADLLVLLVYVLLDWIRRGLPEIVGVTLSPMDVTGVCETFLYLSYVFRFLSVWLLVIFTFERYIGVCHPLKRRKICTRASARRIISGLVLFALAFSAFKPALSTVSETLNNVYRCQPKAQYVFENFVLDIVFGLSVTLLPFIIVLSLNACIVRKLYLRKRQQRLNGFLQQENKIRIEFTVILLSISTCFILLNLPYFITFWYNRYISRENNKITQPLVITDYDELSAVLLIVKAIFYINYSINFFLYSITGAYFRKEMKTVFNYRFRRNNEMRISKTTLSHSTPQSVV